MLAVVMLDTTSVRKVANVTMKMTITMWWRASKYRSCSPIQAERPDLAAPLAIAKPPPIKSTRPQGMPFSTASHVRHPGELLLSSVTPKWRIFINNIHLRLFTLNFNDRKNKMATDLYCTRLWEWWNYFNCICLNIHIYYLFHSKNYILFCI